jgi:hypothetical protein
MAGPTQADIDKKIDELQVALDAEQQQVKDLLAEKDGTITSLNAIITDLNGQLADGGTAEQRQATLDKINALKDDLVETVPPGKETPPPPPEG